MYFGSSFPYSLWQLFKQLQKKLTWHLDGNDATEAHSAMHHFNSIPMPSLLFLLQRDPWTALCPWGRVILFLRGGWTRGAVTPLWTWFSGSTKWRETGGCGLTISPCQPDARYSTVHRAETHKYHTHTVIYYSNKSLALPNFLWISISPWTYLHWSTSGVRMCQASLTVTLKNGSQFSAICVCVCSCVCACVCMCARTRARVCVGVR